MHARGKAILFSQRVRCWGEHKTSEASWKILQNLDFRWGSSAHREADFLLHPLNPDLK